MLPLRASHSSSVLQGPTEQFASLTSPKATVRSRGASGDGPQSSADKSKMQSSQLVDDGEGLPGPSTRPRSGLASPLATDADLAARLRLPTGAALRRGSWAALHAVLLLGTLRFLGIVGKRQRDLWFLYFQPFLPMLAMLWFWAAAVRVFERRRIRYDVCFSPEDQRYLLRSGQLFQISNVLTALVLSAGLAFVYLLAYGLLGAASLLPPALYCALLGLLLFPGGLLHRDTRLFFGLTLWRIATPIRAVSWSDFLLADILTSLAKAISDTERAVCHIMVGPILQPDIQACSDASFVLPLGLAAPYAWRLVQCIRVYLDTGARPQLFNAIKYSTAFPVIALSAVRYHVTRAAWRGFWKPLWLASALLNSAYSFYWDVERDWEISWFSQMGQQRGAAVPAPVLRPQLLYRRPLYLYLMASNLLLRLAWTYKLSPHLRDHHVVVFLIVLAEAFRRFQWLFVRIEVELRKIQGQRPELGVLVPAAPKDGYSALPLSHGHGSDQGAASDSGSEDGGGARHGGELAGASARVGGGGGKERAERHGRGGLLQLPVVSLGRQGEHLP